MSALDTRRAIHSAKVAARDAETALDEHSDTEKAQTLALVSIATSLAVLTDIIDTHLNGV